MPIWVRGHWRRTSYKKNPNSRFAAILIILGIITICAIIIPFFKYLLASLVGLIILIYISRKFMPQMTHKKSIALICLALIGLSIFIYIFLSQLEPTILSSNSIKVNGFTRFKDSMQVQLSPTSTTKPGQPYRIILDNNITKVTYDIQWSQLELDIIKPKVLSDKITPDEYIAWSQRRTYNTTIYELTHQHNPIYLLSGITIFSLFLTPLIYPAIRKRQDAQYYKWLKVNYYISSTNCYNCHKDILIFIPRGTPLIGHKFRCSNCGIINTITTNILEIPTEKVYVIHKQCPICHHINMFMYLKGKSPIGVTVKCRNCGNPYSEGRRGIANS